MNLKREDITNEELREITKRRKEKAKQEKAKEDKKEKKLIEFSKKIMFCILLSAFIIIVFSMYIIRRTNNTTYLDTLIIEVFKFSKVAVMFYYAKAAIENHQKIKNSNNIKQLEIQQMINNFNENNQEEIIWVKNFKQH